MRNLLEYPITAEEVVECLDNILKEVEYESKARTLFGDMRPLLLRTAIEVVREAGKPDADIPRINTAMDSQNPKAR